MSDSYDLDSLCRDQLSDTELGEMPSVLAHLLDDWLLCHHGVLSSSHNVGDFLDSLAAAGYRVALIDPGIPFDELLPLEQP